MMRCNACMYVCKACLYIRTVGAFHRPMPISQCKAMRRGGFFPFPSFHSLPKSFLSPPACLLLTSGVCAYLCLGMYVLYAIRT